VRHGFSGRDTGLELLSFAERWQQSGTQQFKSGIHSPMPSARYFVAAIATAFSKATWVPTAPTLSEKVTMTAAKNRQTARWVIWLKLFKVFMANLLVGFSKLAASFVAADVLEIPQRGKRLRLT